MPSQRMRAVLLVLVCLAWPVAKAAGFDDGFGPVQKSESKHFLVQKSPDIDEGTLLQKLDMAAGEELIANEPSETHDGLSSALDTLYNRIGAFLDMNLYSLQGTLKICRDPEHLKQVYRTIFSKELQAPSFYVNDLNTIYISADHFTKETLGHEIAHMIISHYFVVQPPPKVAEILAGYAEYELRKASRANPR